MSSASRLGSGGASFSIQSERIIQEAVRRARLVSSSDPTFTPPANDAAFLFSVRSFATHGPGATGGGRRLSFGPHLSGGGYDGSADVTLATDATDAATPGTIVSRDGAGKSDFVSIDVSDTGSITHFTAGDITATSESVETSDIIHLNAGDAHVDTFEIHQTPSAGPGGAATHEAQVTFNGTVYYVLLRNTP